ncbi:MAG TPA: hypothetical protein VMI94_21880 [Bryobacteraceae bacterium]|nr:hypothetical protein [Bryobacteraceae bacterium]
MKKAHIRITALACVIPILFLWPGRARAQTANASYPVMAPLDRYLIPDEKAEIALARSAAPVSISGAAEVMVLRRNGYATAVQGSNGFVCIVERSWGKPTDDPEFWNFKVRAPHCFNPAAAKTFLPIFLKKTELVLAGKSKAQILAATTSALEKKGLPSLAPGAMCYMMAKEQYLSDAGRNWHPHLMFFVAGDVEKSWGANLPSSPVIAANDPEERVTVFMILVHTWSDGSPGPSTTH